MNVCEAFPIGILAQAVRQPVIPPVTVSDRSYYIGLVLLVLALIAAGVAAYRMWIDMHDVEDPVTPEELLEVFKEARAAGELNDKEFDRVREQLAKGERPTATPAKAKRLPPS